MKHLKRYEIQMLLDGEVSHKKKEKAEAHLSQCSQCREMKEKVQEQVVQLKSALSDMDPGDVGIADLDLSDKKEIKPKRKYVRIPVPAFAAMLVMILFLGTLLVYQSFQGSKEGDPREIIPAVQYVKFESEDSMKIKAVQLDLSDYSIIKKPRVMVIKGEGNKDEKI